MFLFNFLFLQLEVIEREYKKEKKLAAKEFEVFKLKKNIKHVILLLVEYFNLKVLAIKI